MGMSIKSNGEPPGATQEPPNRNRKARQSGRGMRIRLTAMIDVTFLLLLFFLLTFTFRAAEGQIPGSLPKEGAGHRRRGINELETPLRISVRPTGLRREGAVYEANDYPRVIRTPRELGEFLQRRASQTPKPPVVIEPRGDVQWRWAVEAFNQAVRARFEKVSFSKPS